MKGKQPARGSGPDAPAPPSPAERAEIRAVVSAALVPAHLGEAADEYLAMVRRAVRNSMPNLAAIATAPAPEPALEARPVHRRRVLMPLAAAMFLTMVLAATGVLLAAQPWSVPGGSPSSGASGPIAAVESTAASQHAAGGTATGHQTAGGPSITNGPSDPNNPDATDPSATSPAAGSPNPHATATPLNTGEPTKFPTPTPEPTDPPTPAPTAPPTPTPTPAPTPTPTPEPTPTPTLYVSWVVNPPVPPMLRVWTLPGAVCTVTVPGRGTSKTFTAGSNGQATLNWNSPKWDSGTYELTATCTLGPQTASTPTVTVVVP